MTDAVQAETNNRLAAEQAQAQAEAHDRLVAEQAQAHREEANSRLAAERARTRQENYQRLVAEQAQAQSATSTVEVVQLTGDITTVPKDAEIIDLAVGVMGGLSPNQEEAFIRAALEAEGGDMIAAARRMRSTADLILRENMRALREDSISPAPSERIDQAIARGLSRAGYAALPADQPQAAIETSVHKAGASAQVDTGGAAASVPPSGYSYRSSRTRVLGNPVHNLHETYVAGPGAAPTHTQRSRPHIQWTKRGHF